MSCGLQELFPAWQAAEKGQECSQARTALTFAPEFAACF